MKFRTHPKLKFEDIKRGKTYLARYTFNELRPFYGKVVKVKPIREVTTSKYFICTIENELFSNFRFSIKDFISEVIK